MDRKITATALALTLFTLLLTSCGEGYGQPPGSGAATQSKDIVGALSESSSGSTKTAQGSSSAGKNQSSSDTRQRSGNSAPAATGAAVQSANSSSRTSNPVNSSPFAAHVHSFVKTVFPPTCGEDGYSLYKCACGGQYKDGHTDKTYNHSWALISTTSSEEYCTKCGQQALIHGIVRNDAFQETGVCYYITPGKELVIHGSGAIQSVNTFNDPMVVIYKHPWIYQELYKITIADGITSIGNNAFYKSEKYVSEVTLGDGLTSIGQYSFMNFTSLKIIKIPKGLTQIAHGAFAGCTLLKSVYIPQSLSVIGQSAFDYTADMTIHFEGSASEVAQVSEYILFSDTVNWLANTLSRLPQHCLRYNDY